MSLRPTVASIVLAAGSGTRFGHDINKVWLPLNGRHIISRSLTNAAASFEGARIVLVINPDICKPFQLFLFNPGKIKSSSYICYFLCYKCFKIVIYNVW
jgi:2-C-methyl-D-erythritol 4-phosphate cytidylyltransferase